jgi:ADP-ribose diphosphatase
MAARAMGADDLRVIERSVAYRGYVRVERYRLRHRLFAGGWSGEIVREVIERGHAVAVLPYDSVRDQVVLLEQFRVAAHAGGHAPWQTEIVAGIIEDGEDEIEVAHRETVEECGCEPSDLVPSAAS